MGLKNAGAKKAAPSRNPGRGRFNLHHKTDVRRGIKFLTYILEPSAWLCSFTSTFSVRLA